MEEKKESRVSELVYIQSNLKAPKNQRNNFGGYNYRSCEDIMEAVKPLLKETNCTLTVSDEVVQVADRIYVKATATLRTPSGETFINTAFAREPLSKKGQDESQVTGAASSYARKYALNGLFCIDDTKDADALNTSKEYTQQSLHQQVQHGSAGNAAGTTANVQDAIKAIGGCTDMNGLVTVWQQYPSLQQDKMFRDAWAARRGQVEPKK